MRKALFVLLSIAFFAAPGARAGSGDHPVRFEALPCAYACAHMLPYELGYRACEKPFPNNSYADVLTEVAPTPDPGHKVLLVFEAHPLIDWDTFICSYPEMRDSSNNCGCVFPEPCDGPLGDPVPVGCSEKLQAPATAGRQYVLRAYNFSDPFPLEGVYRWVFI